MSTVATVISQGTLAARPAAGAGVNGYVYYATDTGQLAQCWFNGTTYNWIQIAASSMVANSSQQAGTSYTFALADAGTVVEFTAATAVTATIPPHSSVAFPVGAVIEVFQDGAGQVTITAGAGVTLRSDGARLKTTAQYSTIGLRQRATDEWVVSGDLTA